MKTRLFLNNQLLNNLFLNNQVLKNLTLNHHHRGKVVKQASSTGVGGLLALMLLVSCSGKNAQQPSTPSPTVSASAPDAAHQLRADGVGAVKVGMTVSEASKAIGSPLLTLQGKPLPSTIATESCYYAASQSPTLKGVSFMLNQGKVVRADVADEGTIKTAAGLGVGATQAEVEKAYAGQVQVTPDKYIQKGKNLIVSPPNQPENRIIFETENDRVTTIRAGRVPEVELVERCG
jgi:hypothetical protein